jgi:hypothetical protein
MSNRIVELYRQHQLVAALNNGKFQGRVYKKDKNMLDLEGDSIADVQNKLRDYVDTLFDSEASSRKQATTEELLTAFRNILPKLNDNYLAMIRAHYHAPDRRITATLLAKAAGYDGYSSANLHYGYIGKYLYEELPMNIDKGKNGKPIYTFMLADAAEKTGDEDHWVWQMRPEVAGAIQALGLDK